MIIQNIHTIFASVEAAEIVAAQVRRDDPEWSYTVVPDPLGSGRAVIRISDEDGNVLGNL